MSKITDVCRFKGRDAWHRIKWVNADMLRTDCGQVATRNQVEIRQSDEPAPSPLCAMCKREENDKGAIASVMKAEKMLERGGADPAVLLAAEALFGEEANDA